MDGPFFSFLRQQIVSYRITRFQNMQTLIVTAVVMVLRIWAMYNRSRPIFGVLLILFSLEVIFSIITIAVDSNPKNLPGM